jgi:signal transduction histidine kinase
MDSSKQKTLLIVDDNPTNIKVLFELLKESGFRVLVAKDGESTLTKLEAAMPDLILLDVMMPGIDGFETCRRIKQDPKNETLPIIFMTALTDTVNKLNGLSLGAVDYIIKPFQQEEVLARINVHLKIRNLQQELAEKNTQLSNVNILLEKKVAERTDELQKAQSQLILNEKMSSLGQLVAGIAHEINNPLAFISGNINYAHEFAESLIDLVRLYQKYYPEADPEIVDKIAEIQLDYIVNDFPKLIASMAEGTKRITNISQSMRNFSRGDHGTRVYFNLHEGIDSTLMILSHRLKADNLHPEINIVKEYGNLPEIECYPGLLNQVFMNLLANAIEAVEDSNQGRSFSDIQKHPNCITIRTDIDRENRLIISIKDNGVGMTPEVQARIFDHLYTTKALNKGTGLGLSITQQIVEEKHGGKLTCSSTFGVGTEFMITIPQ